MTPLERELIDAVTKLGKGLIAVTSERDQLKAENEERKAIIARLVNADTKRIEDEIALRHERISLMRGNDQFKADNSLLTKALRSIVAESETDDSAIASLVNCVEIATVTLAECVPKECPPWIRCRACKGNGWIEVTAGGETKMEDCAECAPGTESKS